MANVIAPPSATDTVVLSLLNMFSDPEGAKKAIKAYNDARVAAEATIREAVAVQSENTKEAERLANVKAELDTRNTALEIGEADLARDRAALEASVGEHKAAVRAHDSAVKQANTDASRRDSELGRREYAVGERERVAAEKHDTAEALRKKYQDALDRMRAAVA